MTTIPFARAIFAVAGAAFALANQRFPCCVCMWLVALLTVYEALKA